MKRWAARERSKNRGKVRSLKRGGGLPSEKNGGKPQSRISLRFNCAEFILFLE